jgi:hypothetical protein
MHRHPDQISTISGWLLRLRLRARGTAGPAAGANLSRSTSRTAFFVALLRFVATTVATGTFEPEIHSIIRIQARQKPCAT